TKKEVNKDKILKRQLLESDLDNDDDSQHARKEKIHRVRPESTADFMALFNKREGLKYLTHDYDEGGFKFDEEWSRMKGVFDEKTKHSNLMIPSSLYAITSHFAFNKKTWTSLDRNYKDIKIYQGWASTKWEKWSKENELHPIRNDEFMEVINDFRRITRIDAPKLETIIDL